MPSAFPSSLPTAVPSREPTSMPSLSPTASPSPAPTVEIITNSSTVEIAGTGPKPWSSVNNDAIATRLIATVAPGLVYVSTDSGE